MRIDPIGVQPYVPNYDYREEEIKSPVKKGIDASYYKDTIQHAKEHYLDKEFLNVMSAQHKNHLDSTLASSASLKSTITANQEIRKNLFDQQDELIKKQKKSDVLSIVDKVAMAGLVLTGLVSLGLTLIAGVGIPLFLTVASAVCALLSGIFKIGNAVNEDQMNTIASEIFVLGEQRKMNQSKTMDHMDQQNNSQDKAHETFKIMSDNETNKHETARAVIARS